MVYDMYVSVILSWFVSAFSIQPSPQFMYVYYGVRKATPYRDTHRPT